MNEEAMTHRGAVASKIKKKIHRYRISFLIRKICVQEFILILCF
jgi:hypothetical protein